MADTLICLVRHGQSSHNLRELVAGQVPSCLTRRGREDARAVAVLLKGRPFDLIYSSDLRRALQTAEVIRDSLGLGCPIRISSLLRELDYGRFTQRPVRETFAFLDYRRRRDRPYPGGESFGDLKRRAEAFAERLRSEAGGRSLLITAHAGPIRMLLAVLGAVGLEELPLLSVSNRYAGVVVLDDRGRLKDYRVLSQELEASP